MFNVLAVNIEVEDFSRPFPFLLDFETDQHLFIKSETEGMPEGGGGERGRGEGARITKTSIMPAFMSARSRQVETVLRQAETD